MCSSDLDETGLHYYRNRYYHAQLGRFVSRDPIEYEDGRNLYAAYFVPNGVDPLGLVVQSGCGDLIVGDVLPEDEDEDEDEDDDVWSKCGGPGWRDWIWAVYWGCGSTAVLPITGELLQEYKSDSDVKKAIVNIKRGSLDYTPAPGGAPSCQGQRTVKYRFSGKERVDLQDTIFSLGDGFLFYDVNCTSWVSCKKCCDGTEVETSQTTVCIITFRINDKWEKPIGNRCDFLVNWWRDDGFPIRGSWTETTSRKRLIDIECP